jgi:predicted extracellular nuclease
MTVVAPTGGRVDSKTGAASSDGTFYVVLKGTPRPFREPGFDVREVGGELDSLRRQLPKLRIFDANPELVRVDSDEQTASVNVDLGEAAGQKGVSGTLAFEVPSVNVPAGAELKDLTGVMHFASGRYTILSDYDSKFSAATTVKAKPLPSPTDRQFSVAGMNLENFFDDVDDPGIKEDVVTPEAFARRLKKISVAIRDHMQSPDVIGTIEVENLAVLKKLAARVNADAVASGKPDPKYEAFLIDGNDGRGIDSGFLVRTARVKVLETKQLGKDDKYKNPDTGEENFLNDRPPFMIRASVTDPSNGKPFEFTVIVNHLKSFLGYSDPKQMANVRLKKRLQAEFLAAFLQQRLKQDPNERIAVIGDFNAFQFNDGILDVIGTIKGRPAGKDEVLNPSEDLVDPDLTDLVDVINEKDRYSYSFDGNGQVLDHILISDAFKNHVSGFGYARVNADFPEVFRNDADRVERFSDHDPAIAYFTFDDVAAAKRK